MKTTMTILAVILWSLPVWGATVAAPVLPADGLPPDHPSWEHTGTPMASSCVGSTGEEDFSPVPATWSASEDATAPEAGDGYFDWPMGITHESAGLVMGYGAYVMQNFGNVNPNYGNRRHSALDIALIGGGSVSAHAPVYAAADGVVRCAEYVNYPGYVVVIEHTLPDGSTVYTQYGHLEAPLVLAGESVTRGDQIGTVLPWPGNLENSHVHFEVRQWLEWSSGNCWGPGYATSGHSPEEEGWLDPREWYFAHRPPFPGDAAITPQYTMNVRQEPTTSSAVLGQLPPSTLVTAQGVMRDADGNPHWWYQVSGNGLEGFVAGFYWLGWGSDLYVGEKKRGNPVSPCAGIVAPGNPGGALLLLFLPLVSLLCRRQR
ncbi:MAG: hypothetical protein D6795_12795 [Deltaproteobacteria bacterium]|nr:MAG: hypothetical protein D6795_12795 [Deltaproteobacteria bacterium]